MKNYEIINTYNEEQYKNKIEHYKKIGCHIYNSPLGGAEAYVGTTTVAVIRKCF